MLSFRKFLAFGLLFISLFPLTSSAGLYSTDYNSFSKLKKKLTDFNNYRYAALIYSPANGDSFESYIILAKTYADILEKDMGVKVKLYETDSMHLQNINNFRLYAAQEINRKDFDPGNSTCSVATTFLYPSAVSGVLRIMGPGLVLAKDDPAIRADIVNESKHYLSEDISLLMKMCDRSKFREQNNAFKEFLKALQGEQNYITSEAGRSLYHAQAVAASAAEDAARDAASKKALEQYAAKDKKDQEIEHAREAKIIADRKAELAEQKRQAQLKEDARQKVLAAHTPDAPKQEPTEVSSARNNNAPTSQRPNVAANEPYPGYSLLTEEDIQRCVLSGRWYFHAASMRDQGESPDLIYQNLMALAKLPSYNHPPTDMEQIINMVILAFPGESPAMITDKMMTSCKRVVAKHRIENNPFDWTGMGI